ncbi:unnamed protein product [Gulo gulo]|uniref:Uncharacterized protein n=1 Tax=Gulo gulo TaxID=48420 RepID=A0A9X9LI80_GULGU|nr:unnamed protein product [Gulo gulo]
MASADTDRPASSSWESASGQGRQVLPSHSAPCEEKWVFLTVLVESVTRSGTISCFKRTHLRPLALGSACANRWGRNCKRGGRGDREPPLQGARAQGHRLPPRCHQASPKRRAHASSC